MVSKILDGISIKIKQAFGDAYEIYVDHDSEQGSKESCFFISIMEFQRKKLTGRLYSDQNAFVIQYFPEIAGSNTEMIDAAEKLFLELEFIELADGDLLHGTKMHYRITEGILSFFINFDMHIRIIENADLMQQAKITVEEQ